MATSDDDKSGDEIAPEEIEQVEEAIDAVEDALEEGDITRAEKILGQLEAWKSDLSSTLEKATQSQVTPILDELRKLRRELQSVRRSTPRSERRQNQTPEAEEQTPTPPTDVRQMERQSGDADASPVKHTPAEPPSPRQQRRWI